MAGAARYQTAHSMRSFTSRIQFTAIQIVQPVFHQFSIETKAIESSMVPANICLLLNLGILCDIIKRGPQENGFHVEESAVRLRREQSETEIVHSQPWSNISGEIQFHGLLFRWGGHVVTVGSAEGRSLHSEKLARYRYHYPDERDRLHSALVECMRVEPHSTAVNRTNRDWKECNNDQFLEEFRRQ